MYLLQGISGKYVQFSLQQDELDPEKNLEFLDDSVSGNSIPSYFEGVLIKIVVIRIHFSKKYIISSSTKALIHRLSEVGYLYTRVETFVREREGASAVGMIEQSLCHHLQAQLTEYYRLIAVLESQMANPSMSRSSDGNPQRTNGHVDREMEEKGEETGLTLRRLDVWINEWRLRMRMMSVCVEGARGVCFCEVLLSLVLPANHFIMQRLRVVH